MLSAILGFADSSGAVNLSTHGQAGKALFLGHIVLTPVFAALMSRSAGRITGQSSSSATGGFNVTGYVASLAHECRQSLASVLDGQ